MPVHALSSVFKARFRKLIFKRHPEISATLPAAAWESSWVVHSKPVGSGQKALRYLARYLYRVAIANEAIRHADDHAITFRYRDGATRKSRTCTLSPREFLRRFLQHVLPKGFVKTRYFGLHHSAKRATLSTTRAMLHLRAGTPPAPAPVASAKPSILCVRCSSPMVFLCNITTGFFPASLPRGPPHP